MESITLKQIWDFLAPERKRWKRMEAMMIEIQETNRRIAERQVEAMVLRAAADL